MKSSHKVLFVCLGNICRSPAADNVFRHLVSQAGKAGTITCDSAGILKIHTGKQPDPRMVETLRSRGYSVKGSARGGHPRDFAAFDLILGMDHQNRKDLLDLGATPEEKAKVRLFSDFCSHHHHPEVPDPYHGGAEAFEQVADLIEDGAAGLLAHLSDGITPDSPAPRPS